MLGYWFMSITYMSDFIIMNAISILIPVSKTVVPCALKINVKQKSIHFKLSAAVPEAIKMEKIWF